MGGRGVVISHREREEIPALFSEEEKKRGHILAWDDHGAGAAGGIQ